MSSASAPDNSVYRGFAGGLTDSGIRIYGKTPADMLNPTTEAGQDRRGSEGKQAGGAEASAGAGAGAGAGAQGAS
jgi:hypothetical protein